jgi:uncharacterized protein involved in exopolysaccharide biosynthesis
MQVESPRSQNSSPGTPALRLEDVIYILLQRRKFILLFSAGVAILTLIVVLILRDEFTASVIVLPPAQNFSAGSSLLSQLGQGGILGSSFGVKTQGDLMVSLLRTETVENDVILRFRLMRRYHCKKLSDARKAFERRSKVSLGSRDGLVTIHVTDHDPKLAAEVANGYLDAYQKLSAQIALTEASQRRLFYEQQLLEANENLSGAEIALKNTQQSTGVLQVEGQTQILIESAAALRAQVVAKEVQLESMHSYATVDNPSYLQAEQQLHALQEQLSRLGGSDQDAALLTPNGKVAEADLEYINKLRDVKFYETISELLARQYEIAKQDEAREGGVLQVVERATPPDSKSGPHRVLAVILAFLMGLFIACGWSLVLVRLPRPILRRPTMDSNRCVDSGNV